jgi:AmmeMemoRadiSam system protein A
MLPLTDAQQQSLLRLARASMDLGVRGLRPEDIPSPSDWPTVCFGVFVSLHKGERLRGCIGHIEALKPLAQTVRECALASALCDPRFEPVTADELPGLRIEISVLSPFVEITPEQVEVGVHGLLISRGSRRGLLLPQVAVQWEWDRERFLSETCRKAGLDGDAWQHGAKIQAFTAQVFAEPAVPVHSSPHAA